LFFLIPIVLVVFVVVIADVVVIPVVVVVGVVIAIVIVATPLQEATADRANKEQRGPRGDLQKSLMVASYAPEHHGARSTLIKPARGLNVEKQ
jgi:hypothetical protein